MRSLIRRLRTGLPPIGGEPSDEQLLERFLTHRATDAAEEAFAGIVRRHGPMVRGVCRRVLRNDADTDDAFQAVFVVLLRKADTIRPRNRLGNWLYGVAVNVARRGRDRLARHRTQELIGDVPGRETEGVVEQHDLRAMIDEELQHLPDTYRAAVVACDLEGATRVEAAARLGWSEGTVASRLARGRVILADRLSRRGFVIPAAGLLAVLAPSVADAISPLNFYLLVSNPAPAVESLAVATVQSMGASKLKVLAIVLCAAGLTGAGTATVWAYGGFAERPLPPVAEVKPLPPRVPEPPASPVWNRPAPKDVPVFVEKPAAADAGVAKPGLFVMTNPAADITIVSDRQEKFVEFFRRQPVMIALVPGNIRDRLLHDAKGPQGFLFVDSASFNVDGPRAAAYGASVKLAPVIFNGPVFRLLEKADTKQPVVFVRDAKDGNLWHAVGFTTRSSVGFFTAKERGKGDDFAPADLLQVKPKK